MILLCLRKFDPSFMVDGGVSFFGQTYGQTHLFYKENMEEIKERNNANLILEQEGASWYKTKLNIALLNDLFVKERWIQNPPNSQDLAYLLKIFRGLLNLV